MPKEYEYRFIFDNILTEKILRKKLSKISNIIHYDPIIFKILVYNSNNNNEYIRIRDATSSMKVDISV